MPPKPLLIPGWPSPTEAQVKLFQENNSLKVDGIAGPKTMGRCWLPKGDELYTYLGWSVAENGLAESSKAWTARALQHQQCLPLDPSEMFDLFGLLSSDWETGYDFLSTQDGITFGMRRLAARTFRKFANSYDELFREHVGDWGVHQLKTRWSSTNNSFPLDEEYLRAGLINAAADEHIWRAQFEEAVNFIASVLERYPRWKKARTIALAVRVGNSASGKLDDLPQDDEEAYEELKSWYLEHRGRGKSRVRRIEELFPANLEWK